MTTIDPFYDDDDLVTPGEMPNSYPDADDDYDDDDDYERVRDNNYYVGWEYGY